VSLAVALGVGACTVDTDDDVASLAAQRTTGPASLGDARNPDVPDAEAGLTSGALGVGDPAGARDEGTQGTASSTSAESISLAEARERQPKTADAFYSCLVAAELPFEAYPQDDGQVYVNWTQDRKIVFRDGSVDAAMVESNGGTDEEALREFANGEGYGLLVDGVDRSEDYIRCRDESGYFEPVLDEVALREERDRFNQLSVDATYPFAVCARENGYPDVADPAVIVDPTLEMADPLGMGEMVPGVELPLTMSEDDLRALLAACRPYDPDLSIDGPVRDGTGAPYPVVPVIKIERPPGGIDDGRIETDPQAIHWNVLHEILMDNEMVFWDAWDARQ
jgi:hypothetical protein